MPSSTNWLLKPYLKLSGVGIALADVFELDGELEQAYNLYQEVFKMMQDATGLTGNERLCVVAIADKIGEHAETLNKPQAEEEKHLQAVEEVLRLVEEANDGEIDPDVDNLVLADLDLPPWASLLDVGAPLEALAGFHRRIGHIILIPPPPKESPPKDQCRGAQLMGNISELILHRPGKLTPERLNQAESWAKQALATLQKTRKLHEPIPVLYKMLGTFKSQRSSAAVTPSRIVVEEIGNGGVMTSMTYFKTNC
ncbi:hypothetical protein BDZ89DRAFT_1240601 [Hymenopellis radicata]|nr:hypothetical protein BDZ89DRAFT_1240601 [Hymenopellis radicata]